MVDIKSESASTELQERIESNKQELDRCLGIYPYDRFFVLVLCLVVHSIFLQFTSFHYAIISFK